MSVNRPTPHDSARLHVTGAARYVDDIPTPAGCLHLVFGKSLIAHGTITAMDLSAVRTAEGVVAVLTAEDLPFENDVSPSIHDEPLLATGTVHYIGQPIFLVVATSHTAARKAATLAQVDYAELPPIFTIEEAMAANSRFEEGPRIYSRGDSARAIAASPHTAEGVIDMGGQEPFLPRGPSGTGAASG